MRTDVGKQKFKCRASLQIEANRKMPKKVEVLYYLSRNGQLEHPHSMEVVLSSYKGLYLKDVLRRLNELRGIGIADTFSWSCKRSYKNGYVWHDLAEDDLVLPAQGNDYVLKGSELFQDIAVSVSDKLNTSKHFEDASLLTKYQDFVPSTSKNLNTLANCRMQRTNSTGYTSNTSAPRFKSSQFSKDNSSEDVRASSMKSRTLSWNAPDIEEYPVHRAESATFAVAQEADTVTQVNEKNTISIPKICAVDQGTATQLGEKSQMQRPAGNGKECKSEFVESSKNRHENQKPAEKARNESVESSYLIPVRTKASAMLLKLISCGSITVKDYTYDSATRSKSSVACDESKVAQLEAATSRDSSSRRLITEEDLGCMLEKLCFAKLQIDEKEYFSGSILETEIKKDGNEGETLKLKRCPSYDENRTSDSHFPEVRREDTVGIRNKYVPREITESRKQNDVLKSRSRFAQLPRNLGRSFNAPSTLTFASDPKVDANGNSESILTNSESFQKMINSDNKGPESFRTTTKEKNEVEGSVKNIAVRDYV